MQANIPNIIRNGYSNEIKNGVNTLIRRGLQSAPQKQSQVPCDHKGFTEANNYMQSVFDNLFQLNNQNSGTSSQQPTSSKKITKEEIKKIEENLTNRIASTCTGLLPCIAKNLEKGRNVCNVQLSELIEASWATEFDIVQKIFKKYASIEITEQTESIELGKCRITLSWDSKHAKLLKQLFNVIPENHDTTQNQMRKEDTLCDATFVVDNQKFPVHKVLLCKKSSYFRELFTKNLDAKEIPYGDNLSASLFEELLTFIYTGYLPETEKTPEELEQLSKEAKKLELDTLHLLCTAHLLLLNNPK